MIAADPPRKIEPVDRAGHLYVAEDESISALAENKAIASAALAASRVE
jgi:hypothetical protein